MAQGHSLLPNNTAIELLDAIEDAAEAALDGTEGRATLYKVRLVCPNFTATPIKVLVDSETKQVEIHFDY